MKRCLEGEVVHRALRFSDYPGQITVFHALLARLSCRDDPHHCFAFAKAVADDEDAKLKTHAKKKKTVSIIRTRLL